MRTVQKVKKRYSLFTNKQLLWLIAPIVIENIFSTSLGMFDGIMVSSIDEFGHASNAVGNVDYINNLVIQLFSAFATGGTIITSQFLGAKNIADAKKSAKHMLVIVLGFSLVIAGLCLALNPYLLQLFYPDVESDVMELQRTYFYITALVMLSYLLGQYVITDGVEHHAEPMTMAFISLCFIQLFHAFNLRSQRNSVLNSKFFSNKPLNLSALVGIALTLFVVLTPGVKTIFIEDAGNDFMLSWVEWLVSVGVAVAIIPLVEMQKLIERLIARKRKG